MTISMEFRTYIFLITMIVQIGQLRGEMIILLHGTDINGSDKVAIIEGETLLLECIVDSGDANVYWSLKDNVISRSERLELPRIRLEDEGYYTCILTTADNVTSTVETVIEQKTVFVEILYPPSYPLVTIPKSVIEGENLCLACSVVAHPEPTYQWRRDLENGLLLTRNQTYHFTAVANVALFCNIQNQMSPTFGEPRVAYVSRKIYIAVHRMTYIRSIYPGSYITKYEGDDLILKCFVEGSPPPRVWWSKEGNDSFHWLGGEYYSYDVRMSSAGTYICHSENTVTAANQSSVTIHKTEAVHVRVRASVSQPQCDECLKHCPTQPDATLKTTAPPEVSGFNVGSSATTPFVANCSQEHSVNSSNSIDTVPFIGLVAAACTGWIATVTLVVVNVLIYIKLKAKAENEGGNRTESEGQDQNTITGSAYVSNFRLPENTYTDLTTYDQINSGSGDDTTGHNCSRDWEDTGSQTTQSSVVSYLEPMNNFP